MESLNLQRAFGESTCSLLPLSLSIAGRFQDCALYFDIQVSHWAAAAPLPNTICERCRRKGGRGWLHVSHKVVRA